jgi:hypothetical protein
MLDRHFNDEEGYYAASWSDRIIAEAVKPPIGAAAVRVIREAAFGPERVSPEVTKLGEDITAANVLLEKALKSAKDALATATGLGEAIRDLEHRQKKLMGK